MTITEKLNALAAATNLEIYDPEFVGWNGDIGWLCEAVETAETLDNFAESSASWNQKTAPVRGEIAGLPYIAWKTVQLRKGDERSALSVIDLGDHRVAAHGVWLPDYQ